MNPEKEEINSAWENSKGLLDTASTGVWPWKAGRVGYYKQKKGRDLELEKFRRIQSMDGVLKTRLE